MPNQTPDTNEIKTIKKYVTISWSHTVEVEIPVEFADRADVDGMESYSSPAAFKEIISEAVKQASTEINWKDGIITDVQDVE